MIGGTRAGETLSANRLTEVKSDGSSENSCGRGARRFQARLTLTDGSMIEREVSHLMMGPVFEGIRSDPKLFAQVRAEDGTVVWPNGADLCPDVLNWGGEGAATRASPQVGGVEDVIAGGVVIGDLTHLPLRRSAGTVSR